MERVFDSEGWKCQVHENFVGLHEQVHKKQERFRIMDRSRSEGQENDKRCWQQHDEKLKSFNLRSKLSIIRVQRHMEETAIKDANIHRVIVAKSMASRTTSFGLHNDLLPIELFAYRKLQ